MYICIYVYMYMYMYIIYILYIYIYIHNYIYIYIYILYIYIHTIYIYTYYRMIECLSESSYFIMLRLSSVVWVFAGQCRGGPFWKVAVLPSFFPLFSFFFFFLSFFLSVISSRILALQLCIFRINYFMSDLYISNPSEKRQRLSHLQHVCVISLWFLWSVFQVSWKPGRCEPAWSSWRRISKNLRELLVLLHVHFICLVFLWYFYGISMVFLWCFYRISTGSLWFLQIGKELRREASGWHSKKMQQLRRLQVRIQSHES